VPDLQAGHAERRPRPSNQPKDIRMSEIEQYAPRAEMALQTFQDAAVHRLAEWAQSAQAAHQIATTLVQTSFCPDAFRNKPGEATAAILAGVEVGLQPMAALRSFDVIQGQAAPRAITLRAIVQSQGHEMELVESTATRCRMRGRRRGSTDWQGITWTLDRARDLGVTGKPNWKNQPQAMLVARATSELARLIASDAILGLPYSSEEVADGGSYDQQVGATTTTATEATGTRKMSRPKTSGAEGVPVEPETSSVEQPPTSAPESPMLNTSSKLAKLMFALMGDLGITLRDDRLLYVSDVVGRTVTSSTEMTDRDAEQVVEALRAELDKQEQQGATPVDAEIVEES
jgi:hypothetical protein